MRLARNNKNRGQIFNLERKLLTEIVHLYSGIVWHFSQFSQLALDQLPVIFINSPSEFCSSDITKPLLRHYLLFTSLNQPTGGINTPHLDS